MHLQIQMHHHQLLLAYELTQLCEPLHVHICTKYIWVFEMWFYVVQIDQAAEWERSQINVKKDFN